MLFLVDWIADFNSSISLPWESETYYLSPDFEFHYVTCLAEWDVSGCDATKDLKCAYAINFSLLNSYLSNMRRICYG